MGISLVEISDIPSPKIWQAINDLKLDVYGDIGISYPVAETFSKTDSALINQVESKASAYLAQPSVKAIGLFSYGAVDQQPFRAAIAPFVDQLQRAGNPNIYFVSDRSLPSNEIKTDFYLYNQAVTPSNIESLQLPGEAKVGGYIFSPSSSLKNYLSPFKHFLEITSANDQKPVFVNGDWLLSTIHKHPQFKSTLRSLCNEADAIFPVPKESLPKPDRSPLPVIILFVVWGIAALHYNTSPLYRKSLFRYFGAHKFFIDDIFHRQIRSALPAFLIIFQNALLVGACAFISFNTFWSKNGKEALFYHFPAFKAFGANPISLLIWGLIVSISISLVGIIWLYLSHRRSNSMIQTATIFAWPLHLNLITGTIAIANFSAGGNNLVIAIFSVITILIFLSSFIFTSIDISRFKASRPALYFLGTAGIYLVLMGGYIAWIMTYDAWWEIIKLSLALT